MIDVRNSPDITIVRRRYIGENSLANESFIFGRACALPSPYFSFHFVDSFTPNWMKPMSSAGRPPNTNIHRHPKLAPMK